MLKQEIVDRIRTYGEGADEETLRETLGLLIDAMAAGQPEKVEDAFYQDLDFGTGGLRGLMGAGTNRMNRFTVGKATQGLCNYVLQHAGENASICIAYDSRNNSREFARYAAQVIAGNGLTTYLFRDVRPTPELSFAVRHFHATAGIVITASHNPKEYNGYKVAWDDGAQVVPPHDKAIIQQVRSITSGKQIKRMMLDEAVEAGKIKIMGQEVDDAFLKALDKVRTRRDLTSTRGKELKIVYTPLHGTGIKLVPQALDRWGFSNVVIVPEQAEPDGNFPTTKSPNPEEKVALQMALDLARKEKADALFATDPDADRIGIAVLHKGDYRLMTGNQVGALLAWYICSARKAEGKLPANGVLIKTIVTTELITRIAEQFGVGVENVLTGFKYIAELIRRYEEEGTPEKPSKTFLMGCEESYGYLVGTHARDKDSVVAACVLAEMLLWLKTENKTVVDILEELYAQHGIYIESQLSKSMPGAAGMRQISDLMQKLRTDPPRDFAGIAVSTITDVKEDTVLDVASGKKSPGAGLPSSNVLVFTLADGSLVIARPSGTEPKIKFYFMVVDREGLPLKDTSQIEPRIKSCEQKEQSLLKAVEQLLV